MTDLENAALKWLRASRAVEQHCKNCGKCHLPDNPSLDCERSGLELFRARSDAYNGFSVEAFKVGACP